MFQLSKAALFACLILSPAIANASSTPYPYIYFGNVVTVGANGCSAVLGTFPASASLFVDSTTGNVTSYYINILLQNPSAGLSLQYITDVLFPSSGGLTSYDPQLLGNATALTGVSGSYSGPLSFPTNNFLELGANFGQSDQTPLVLNAPIAGTGQTCTLKLNGVLKTAPN